MGWFRKTIAFWLAALGLSLALGSSGFREDELECEQAVAHLIDCCQDFSAGSVKCEYQNDGCTTVYTTLSIAESQCIEQRSCSSVRSTGLCTKVPSLLPPVIDTVNPDAGHSHPAVCP